MSTAYQTARLRAAMALALCMVLVLALIAFSHRSLGDEVQAPGAHPVLRAQVIEAGRDYPDRPPASDAWKQASLPDNWDGQRPDYEG